MTGERGQDRAPAHQVLLSGSWPRVDLNRRLRADRGNESIASPWQGLNEQRPFGWIAQSFANIQDIFAKNLGLDVGSRPDCFQQFILGDQPSGVLDKVAEDRKGLWSQ